MRCQQKHADEVIDRNPLIYGQTTLATISLVNISFGNINKYYINHIFSYLFVTLKFHPFPVIKIIYCTKYNFVNCLFPNIDYFRVNGGQRSGDRECAGKFVMIIKHQR